MHQKPKKDIWCWVRPSKLGNRDSPENGDRHNPQKPPTQMHYHLSIKTTTHAMFGIIVSLFISCNLNQHILNRDEDNDRTMANIKGEYCIVILHRKDLQQVGVWDGVRTTLQCELVKPALTAQLRDCKSNQRWHYLLIQFLSDICMQNIIWWVDRDNDPCFLVVVVYGMRPKILQGLLFFSL